MSRKKTTQKTGEQAENTPPTKCEHLRPWMYKKGQSGNPAGRPHGISLKEYARVKFRTMTDEEREEFFEGLNKVDLWEMAEGKPDTKTDITSDGKAIVVQAPQAVIDSFNLND